MKGYILSPPHKPTSATSGTTAPKNWGAEQADRYILGIRAACEALADGSKLSDPHPASADGYRLAPARLTRSNFASGRSKSRNAHLYTRESERVRSRHPAGQAHRSAGIARCVFGSQKPALWRAVCPRGDPSGHPGGPSGGHVWRDREKHRRRNARTGSIPG